MAGKLGRQPAVFTARSVASASAMAATLDRLGTPPSASVDRVSAIKDWGLLGNDLYGCCFQADVGHSLMLRSAAEGALVTPTEDDVLALYKAIAGFDGSPETDHGTSELAGCIYLERTGFLGHKATAFSNISTSNHNHLRWAIELFGHCRLGVNLPSSAMEQFDRSEPWDVVPNDGGIIGGHDVPLCRWADNNFWCVTWGKLQQITPAFLTKYLEELYAELYADWIKANGTAVSGFSLPALISDLHSL